ncbi:MAG: chromate transporter [Variibacter sp.]|jgi:chromate transporter|nr:chromate transporter [Variibacter sp.]
MSRPAEIAGLPRPAVPTALELFLAFAKVSVMAFGGVLPWARRMIVEQRRWMTAEEFNEAFSLCQFLPGPNIVNFSVYFGSRCAGPLGAVAALVGVLGPAVVIVMLVGSLYVTYGSLDAVQRVLGGLAAAAAGLIVGVAGKMAEPLWRAWRRPALYVALAIFISVGVFRVPLLWALLAGTPVSIFLAWRFPG